MRSRIRPRRSSPAPPGRRGRRGRARRRTGARGEIVYKKRAWRKAAIIMDDYSFGWTSGAGIIADFCAIGGQITKRVFPPLNTTDYASYVRQLPAPGSVDGSFWVVGGPGPGARP